MISQLTFPEPLRSGCQIAILAVLLYYVLKFLRRTRAYRILAGVVAVLLALYGGANLFGFDELGWLFEQIAPAIPVMFVVLFQPELRRIFADIGTSRRAVADAEATADAAGVVSTLVDAVGALSQKRIGAILAVEREESLEPYSTGGRRLDAPVNAELLLTIFYRLLPTLIQEGKIYIAESPLFEITTKNDTFYAYNEPEKAGITARLDAEGKKYTLQRSKGLGENTPEMMSLTTMNPATRRLIRVCPADAEATARIFETLLGDDLPARKDFIREYGAQYWDAADI